MAPGSRNPFIILFIVATALVAPFFSGDLYAEAPLPPISKTEPKTTWAKPLAAKGLGNFHQVSPNLYRSAQPTAEGLKAAEELGIRTVINLRAFHSDRWKIRKTSLQKQEITFNTWNAEDEDVIKFLKLVTQTNQGPFLVHCLHGADRTGTMVAIYRIVVEGWGKEEAIEEMTQGPFGYHTVWRNLPKYLRSLDVEKLRKEAGLSQQPVRTPPGADEKSL
jgi:protein tyrosine/serine phosphatase